MFNEGIFCDMTDIISVSKFSLHFAKQVMCNWSYHSSYPLGKFQQSGNQWKYIHSILNAPPREIMKRELHWVNKTAKW